MFRGKIQQFKEKNKEWYAKFFNSAHMTLTWRFSFDMIMKHALCSGKKLQTKTNSAKMDILYPRYSRKNKKPTDL